MSQLTDITVFHLRTMRHLNRLGLHHFPLFLQIQSPKTGDSFLTVQLCSVMRRLAETAGHRWVHYLPWGPNCLNWPNIKEHFLLWSVTTHATLIYLREHETRHAAERHLHIYFVVDVVSAPVCQQNKHCEPSHSHHSTHSISLTGNLGVGQLGE